LSIVSRRPHFVAFAVAIVLFGGMTVLFVENWRQYYTYEVHARPFLIVGRVVVALLLLAAGWHADRLIRDLRMARDREYQQRSTLETTLASIGDAVITAGCDGAVHFINPVAERLTGWKAEDAVGRPISSVFHIINEFSRNPAENPASRVL